MIIALDTETFLIEPGSIFPKLVCLSLAFRDPKTGKIRTELRGNDNMEVLRSSLKSILEDHEMVFHNAGFDLGVIAASMPELVPSIFQALEDGRIHDTAIREKLVNLGTHGKVDTMTMPDGKAVRLSYSLATLVDKYLGRDRSAEKSGESAWRLNYRMLDGIPAADYPDEASKYAMDDAADTLEVFENQQGKPNLGTEALHVGAGFALSLMTAWGMPVDQEAVVSVREQIEGILGGDTLEPLFVAGILTRPVPESPYKNGARNADGTPKMRAAVPTKVKKSVLQLHVLDICREHKLDVRLTDTGTKNTGISSTSYTTFMEKLERSEVQVKWVATDKKWLPELEEYSELIQLFQLRQRFQKLLTAVIPTLEGQPRIYPNFDVLKETGRTSSYGSSLYPSLNIQQQGDKFQFGEHTVMARRMYAPGPGRLFVQADYSSLELCSVAQITHNLFGMSLHKQLLEEGVDLHSYLGAQIAYRFHEDFSALCVEKGLTKAREIYDYFLKAKKHESQEVREFFRHYRTLAKPVGLGYPGGLGPATMRQLAWDTYGVRITQQEAEQFRELWRSTYPEMPRYFDWLGSQGDSQNPVIGRDDDGQPIQGYTYTTPLGMTRRGATFCAAANGAAMQSPAAEGAKIALFQVARECYDPTLGSVLYGARPVAMIHDEFILDAEDDDRAHDRAMRLSEVMCESMSSVLPDVPIQAEACLMRRWSKMAEPVYQDGKLIPWDFPSEDAE